MGRPAFLVDNLLNPRIYPGHTLSASSTESGTSVRSLSAGRRRRDLTGWKASALNADAYVECAFGQERTFDCLWIDRDHNLSGETVGLAISDDGFATETALTNQTVPSAATSGADLRAGTMIRTEEGALLWYLGLQAAEDVQVRFPAMGAGLRPELAGMMLGTLWAPEHAPQKPFDWARPHQLGQQNRSPHAQWSDGVAGSYREGQVIIWCSSFAEAETGRRHIETLYGARRHGMVVIHDDEVAERALFSVCPPGPVGFRTEGDWGYPQVTIPVAEEDPEIR